MQKKSLSRIILPIAITLSLSPFLSILYWIPTDGALPVFANFLGFVGAVLLWWQGALGIRQIANLITNDRQELIQWHIKLGTYGVLTTFTHPILEMISHKASWAFLFIPSFKNISAEYVSYGRFALFGLIAIWLSSAVIKKLLPYRPWRWIHFLAYPTTLLVFAHAFTIGTYLESYPYIKAWWILLATTFAGMTVWRLSSRFLADKSYRIAGINRLPGDVTTYRLTPVSRGFRSTIGQFVYIRYSIFGEAHPFSIMRAHKDGSIELGIKSFGSFTKKLATKKIGDTICISSPQGVFTKEAHDKSSQKVLIAGGIGITPFVGVIEEYTNENTYLINCTRTRETAFFRDTFKSILGSHYIEVLSHEQNVAGSICGLLSKEILKESLPQQILDTANFFICGPTGMMQTATNALVDLGVPIKRIYAEKFVL